MIKGNYKRILFLFFVFVLSNSISFSQISWDGGGDGVNWSSANNWSTNVVPTNADNVVIPNNKNITVDIAAVCASLTIGDNSAPLAATVTIQSNKSLNITTAGGGSGNLAFNPNNKAVGYTLSVGGGTLTVAGSFTSGNVGNRGSVLSVTTGSVTFTSGTAFTFPKGMDVTITGTGTVSFAAAFTLGAASAAESSTLTLQGAGAFTFSGLVTLSDADNIIQNNTTAGTFNFNGGFTLSAGGSASFITMAGTRVNFAGNLNVSTTALVFNAASAAVITGTSSITPTAAITFGDFTIASGGAATLAGNIAVAGDWSNLGGTLTSGGFTVTFSGASNNIGGTASTAFGPVVIVSGSAYTMNNSNSLTTLVINSLGGAATSLTLGPSNPTLTISSTLTLCQPVNAITGFNVNGGTCTVAGVLTFSCNSSNGTDISQIAVTSGSLTTNSSVTFDAASATNNASQVITVTGSGSVTFNSTVQNAALGYFEYGTLSITNNGSMTFALGFDFRGGVLSVGPLATVSFNKTGATAFKMTNTFSPTVTTFSGSTLNFNGDVTITSPALVLAAGSTSIFTAASTITPTSAITFGNVTINSGVTVTQAGNISVTGDWTNLGGTRAGNFLATFNGTGTQTITKAGSTETFYSLTTNTTGPLTLESTTDVNITNTLTMTAGNINLNGRTLQLGVGAVATLVRAAGIMYSNTGVFKRYVQSGTAISSSAAPLYGLFPVGTTTDYRPVALNSSVNPTASGYISVTHYDPPPPSYVVDVAYTDNEGSGIQRISTIVAKVSTSGGFAGGTYSVSVTYSNLSSQGVTTDLKLETYTGSVMGSVGTTFATAGTVAAPVGNRSAVSGANLTNDFVIGTINKAAAGTPIRQYYYSRKNGNWNDNSAGNATWSYTSGGAGASCDCTPVNDGYAVISDGQTVTVNVASTVDFLDIGNASTADGTATLTIGKDLRTTGSGKFSPTAGSWTISRDVFLVGTGNSSWPAASTVTGNLNIGSGTILTMSGGAGVTVTGNLIVDGTLALGTSTLTFNGTAGKTISNTSAGSITGAGATVSITTANKTISAGTNLTIASAFAIASAITVTNSGTVTITGNITGAAGTSTWTNAANSVLNTTGAILATGILNASAGPNTVNYNAAGAQTIKTPASSYYDLVASVSGTKSMAASVSVTDNVTIQGTAILDEAVAAYDLSGAAGLTMTGTSEFIVRNTTNNLTKPDLTGTYSLTGGTVTINSDPGLGAKSTTVRGATYYNLNLIGGNQHKMLNVSSITNDFTVGATVYFNDNVALTVGGATIYSTTGSSTLADDLTTGTYTITAGTFNDGGKNIIVTGAGWTKNGGTFTTTGTTSFTGTTTAQTIGGSASTTFYRLVFNNTFATSPQITLGINTAASNALTMTNGIVNLAGFTFTLGSAGAASTLSRAASTTTNWFYGGTLTRQWLNATAITSTSGNYYGLFPVGQSAASSYNPLEINSTVNPTANGSLSVLYTPSVGNSGHDLNPYYSEAGVSVQHILDASFSTSVAGVTGGTYNLDITMTGLNPAGSVSDIRTVIYTGPTTASAVGVYVASTGTVANPTAHRTGLAIADLTSKDFRLGTSNKGATPLPVEFLSLEAQPDGNVVDVNWSTAVEMNTDYFIVQHSKDGVVFEDVAKVQAAGNSSTLKKYSSIDSDPYDGVSYYRLKQFDLDGKFAFSNIVAVNMSSENEFSVFPNPAKGPFNVGISGAKGDRIHVVVRDILGKELYSEVIVLSSDSQVITIDLSGKLSSGVYEVIASSNHKIYQKKIVIR
jgi:hypothetical protein